LIQRGDVFMVNLDPVVGSEVGKTRPAVILQNELANRSSPTVTVIPISSRVDRVFPSKSESRKAKVGWSGRARLSASKSGPSPAAGSSRDWDSSLRLSWKRSASRSTVTSGSERV